MLSRRFFLGGLLAAPAVIAAGHLMPLRGVKFDPIIRVQSWPLGTDASGAWWSHETRLSKIASAEEAMKDLFGTAYWERVCPDGKTGPSMRGHGYEIMGTLAYDHDFEASRFGVRATAEEATEHHRLAQRAELVPQASYRGGIIRLDRNIEEQKRDLNRAWSRHAQSTAMLRRHLATICKWGA